MLSCVAHERESGKRVTGYFHVCRGVSREKNQTSITAAKVLMRALNTTFWENRPPLPPLFNKFDSRIQWQERRARAGVLGSTRGWKQAVSTVWASAGGNQERLHLEFSAAPNKNIGGWGCRAYLLWLLFVLSGSPHCCLLYMLTSQHICKLLLFFFLHWLCIHSFCMLVAKR